MSGPVVVDYDPAWPAAAELWLERIACAVGNLRGSAAFELDHIGSTAVPGLAAKPIIDLQLLAPELPDQNSFVDALAPLGFELARGSRPDSPGVHSDIPRPSDSAPDPAKHVKQLFHRPPDSVDLEMILHVRVAESPFADFVLAFRDWLRDSSENARQYEAIKRSLAAEHADADDYDDYTRAKTVFMNHAQTQMGWP
ncbi:GrpB family protein [Microbacterium sulfonylureivorans]|uniref:GrpB family protein n=1 Tax=Microbacterium sulfonylureivorans TaxID=2486854 RepID=UPI000FDA2301|nr:GrpB family protein [Microbacterium sulfonylureivorans]